MSDAERPGLFIGTSPYHGDPSLHAVAEEVFYEAFGVKKEPEEYHPSLAYRIQAEKLQPDGTRSVVIRNIYENDGLGRVPEEVTHYIVQDGKIVGSYIARQNYRSLRGRQKQDDA